MTACSVPLRVGLACLMGMLVACGGGGGDGAGTPPGSAASAVIGPAGGTLAGPDGTSLVIPRGALAADTTIGIESTPTGAPARPANLAPSGPTFAFTPHGTTFAVPVTVTLPFDPAAASVNVTPALYKTNAGNVWERVVGAIFDGDRVTATITSFSHAEVILLPLQRSAPVREWEFSVKTRQTSSVFDSGTQTGGQLERVVEFGPMPLDEELFTFTGSVAPNGRAKGFVFGTADGVTYGVFAEAPFGEFGGINQPGGPDPLGSESRLTQRQSFIKRSADASLSFTVTHVLICAFDYNLFPPTFGTDDATTQVIGNVLLDVAAWTKQEQLFFKVSGLAGVRGTRASMTRNVQNFVDGSTRQLWNDASFDFTSDFPIAGDTGLESGGLGFGRDGCLELNGTLTHTIDLSSVAVDEEFTVRSVAVALTRNNRGGGAIGDHQASGVHAYLRDPLGMGGTTLTFVGLESTDRPDRDPPVQAPIVPASCVPGPAPDPAAGFLHFTAASYTIDEASDALQTIAVARSGGSRGAVSATVTTSDGTGSAGTDYTPVATSVFFADGDAAPRTVVVPILGDTVAALDRTVNLTLSQPGGCAALGAQSTAVLTIAEDDGPSTSTVSGALDPSFGNAGRSTASAFGGERSGMALQPDGKVVMAGGSTAAYLLARFNVDGSLDSGFGAGGKVTTDMIAGGIVQEEARAVAIQPDGKIVVAGFTRTGLPFALALARYRADGSLDPTFGSGGKVIGAVQGRAFAMALQADGRILVAGDDPATEQVLVVRFEADGTLDAGFGGAGQVRTDLPGAGDRAGNIALFADGAILVSGDPVGGLAVGPTGLVRYRADGSLDAGFGSGGKLSLPGRRVGEGMALQADRKIVLVGSTETAAPGASRFALMRLNADGTPDAGFGAGGTVSTALGPQGGDAARAVAIQRDGKIVVAGVSGLINPDFAIARYAGDGSLDARFGTGGIATFDFAGDDDVGENVAILGDGRIVIGGLVRDAANGYGLARLSP